MLRTTTLAIIVSGLVACGGSSSTAPSPTPTPSPTPSGTTVSIVRGAVTLTTNAYSPNPLNVAVGTTVTWVNNDTIAHTTTADGGLWDSGTLQPGGQFSFTFQAAGTFPYHCSPHPAMVGTVVVQ